MITPQSPHMGQAPIIEEPAKVQMAQTEEDTPELKLARVAARRRDIAADQRAERARAKLLASHLVEPSPNNAVISYQATAKREWASAAKQRDLARIAVSWPKKRQFLSDARRAEDRAKRAEREAATARAAQIAAHWAAIADAETVALAERRGDTLGQVNTEVPDWERDEDGALKRDAHGMPKLKFEHAKARRRKSGLELLRDKDAIPQASYETGAWYGQLCADAEIAGIAGREETGLPLQPACKPSPGPADWKLAAVLALKRADVAILNALPYSDGAAMILLLRLVCYEGKSVHSLANGDVRKTARLEAKIGTGLAMLRHARLCRQNGLDRP